MQAAETLGVGTKGYATHSPEARFEPFNFVRREVGPHDILIEIAYAGICHSDIHQAKNEWKDSMPTNYPLVPGHEIVGKVSQVGNTVTKFKVGDTAGIGCFIDSCRECPSCASGQEQFCFKQAAFTYTGTEMDRVTKTYGGYSDKYVIDENYALKVKAKDDLAGVAPLMCAGITTYSPLKRFKVGPGQKVGIVGLGGLGHMGVKIAKAMGAEVTIFSAGGCPAAELRAGGLNRCLRRQREGDHRHCRVATPGGDHAAVAPGARRRSNRRTAALMHMATRLAARTLALSLAAHAGGAMADDRAPLEEIRLTPDGDHWRASYTLAQTARELRFARVDRQGHRVLEWTSLDAGIELVQVDGVEVVRRKDGSEFTAVAFRMLPRYLALEKDYTPFSPFSDGGLLIHSGRFHACPGPCEAFEGASARIRVQPPEGAHVIVHGKVQPIADFVEDGDGTNIYVGTATPVETDEVVAVIDPAFPQMAREGLTTLFPVLAGGRGPIPVLARRTPRDLWQQRLRGRRGYRRRPSARSSPRVLRLRCLGPRGVMVTPVAGRWTRRCRSHRLTRSLRNNCPGQPGKRITGRCAMFCDGCLGRGRPVRWFNFARNEPRGVGHVMKSILLLLYMLNLGAFAEAAPARRPPPPPPPPSAPVYQNIQGPEPESTSEPEPTDNDDLSDDRETEDDDLHGSYAQRTRKMRRVDWYLYYAYVACVKEEDFNKCARYAETAAALDPSDDTADQLYDIAVRRGGQGAEKRRRGGHGMTSLGPLRSNHRLGMGALVLLLPDAHSGYLINPEYVFEFKNRSRVFMQLGVGGLVGELNYRKDTDEGEAAQPGLPEAPSPERSLALTGGVRVRFQIGGQFEVGRRSILRIHGGVSGGFLGAKFLGDERTLFLQFVPEVGVTYHLGRLSLGITAAGSALTASEEQVASQGFGVGIGPKFAVGL